MNEAKEEAGGTLEPCAWALKQTEITVCVTADLIAVTKRITSCEIPQTVY